MKEYRLAAWPELRPPFQGTAYRRMLSDISQRHMTLAQLAGASGLRRQEVRNFIDMLSRRGLLAERDTPLRRSLFGWLRHITQGSLPRR
jgi:hypothetical protein